MGIDDRDDIIVLRDENGEEIEFEYLDTIYFEDREYIVLLPADPVEEDEGTVVILEIAEDGDEQTFLPVEPEERLMQVFELFKERMKDEYDFKEK